MRRCDACVMISPLSHSVGTVPTQPSTASVVRIRQRLCELSLATVCKAMGYVVRPNAPAVRLSRASPLADTVRRSTSTASCGPTCDLAAVTWDGLSRDVGDLLFKGLFLPLLDYGRDDIAML